MKVSRTVLKTSSDWKQSGLSLTTYQLTEVSCILPGGEVEALEMLPDGRLLFGIHNDDTLSIHALEVVSCELVGADISTVVNGIQLNDVEGIAWSFEAGSP